MVCSRHAIRLRAFVPIRPDPAFMLVPHPVFLNRLQQVFDHLGVQIIWAPAGTGKSTYLRECLFQLQELKKPSIYINCKKEPYPEHLYTWLRSKCLIMDETVSLTEALTGMDAPLNLCLDQAEYWLDHKNAEKFVVGLATEAVNWIDYRRTKSS